MTTLLDRSPIVDTDTVSPPAVTPLTVPPSPLVKPVTTEGETVEGKGPRGKRRTETPPVRKRHLIARWGFPTVAAVMAAAIIAFNIGWSTWWFAIPFLSCVAATVAAWMFPAYTHPPMDAETERRSIRLRELMDEDVIFEMDAAGMVSQREKTLPEMSLESALASAEKEIKKLRAAATAATAQPDGLTVSVGQLRSAVAETLHNVDEVNRNAAILFVTKLCEQLDRLQGNTQ